MTKTSIWNKIKMPVASIIWLLTMILIVLNTFTYIPLEGYTGFGLIALLFFIGSDRLSFFFYIFLTVGTVFLFLILAFVETWSPLEQAWGIGLHFVFLIHLFALYSISKYVYQFSTENQFLRERILSLEDFISEEGVLTKAEFDKQAKFILSTMRRRNETGYFIEVNISKLPRTVKRTALSAIGSALHTTVRNHFDIVGKYDKNTIVVLLQSTDDAGMEVVKNRIDKHLKMRFEETAIDKMKWTIKHVKGEEIHSEAVVLS